MKSICTIFWPSRVGPHLWSTECSDGCLEVGDIYLFIYILDKDQADPVAGMVPIGGTLMISDSNIYAYGVKFIHSYTRGGSARWHRHLHTSVTVLDKKFHQRFSSRPAHDVVVERLQNNLER